MRACDLRSYLEQCADDCEVFVRIGLDFLDGQPELVAGYKVAWDGDRLVLDASVRLGDLALHAGFGNAGDMPCDGCPLDAASDWLFEHSDTYSLIDELCDRPDNQYRCCFLPEPPSDDACAVSSTCSEGDDVPL